MALTTSWIVVYLLFLRFYCLPCPLEHKFLVISTPSCLLLYSPRLEQYLAHNRNALSVCRINGWISSLAIPHCKSSAHGTWVICYLLSLTHPCSLNSCPSGLPLLEKNYQTLLPIVPIFKGPVKPHIFCETFSNQNQNQIYILWMPIAFIISVLHTYSSFLRLLNMSARLTTSWVFNFKIFQRGF